MKNENTLQCELENAVFWRENFLEKIREKEKKSEKIREWNEGMKICYVQTDSLNIISHDYDSLLVTHVGVKCNIFIMTDVPLLECWGNEKHTNFIIFSHSQVIALYINSKYNCDTWNRELNGGFWLVREPHVQTLVIFKPIYIYYFISVLHRKKEKVVVVAALESKTFQ